MSRLKKIADYLEEVRENNEQRELHKEKEENDRVPEVTHPDTSNEKDKSLYSFNRLKRKK